MGLKTFYLCGPGTEMGGEEKEAVGSAPELSLPGSQAASLQWPWIKTGGTLQTEEVRSIQPNGTGNGNPN
jgi:hypothetical protein